jgi:hypothetical protein
MVVNPSLPQQWFTFSKQKLSNWSSIVVDGFAETHSQSFWGNSIWEMNIQMCCHLCRSSCDFSKQSCTMYVIYFANVDFRRLLLFADVIFTWFLYADITLENDALDTPDNVAVSITDAPPKRAPMTCPRSKQNKSQIFRSFHTDCHPAQSLNHWNEYYRM